MSIDEFSKQIQKLINHYNKTLDNDNLNLWWKEFKNLNYETFARAIDKTITKNKFMPTIEEVRANIETRKMNLDSSYWYANFKDIRPCFNVKTGEPLEPYN